MVSIIDDDCGVFSQCVFLLFPFLPVINKPLLCEMQIFQLSSFKAHKYYKDFFCILMRMRLIVTMILGSQELMRS